METILKEIAAILRDATAAVRSIAAGFDQWLNGSVITRTSFFNIPLTAPMASGVPIGKGSCKAVRLKLNNFEIGTTETIQASGIKSSRILYGDARQQTAELPLFVDPAGGSNGYVHWTPKIYCTDLEQVYVMAPDNSTTNTLTVQVMIYY